MASLDPRRYSYTPSPAITPPPVTGGTEPKPVEPTPAPAVPGPASTTPWNTRANTEAWFRTRGGHELYGLFDQIYKRNPMAGRAFWDSVVGRGRGENDLQAATIHKMFGGNMDQYNDWRNQLHSSGQENQLGNFDLMTGKWTNGGITEDWGWDKVGVGAWDPKYLQTGLQSKEGIDPATGKPYYQSGSEAWKTYGAGQYFDPTRGASYAPPALQQQFAAGQVPGYNQQGQATTPPAPAVSAPPPASPAAPTSTPVAPAVSAPTATNPYGDVRRGGGYQYQQGWRWNNR